MKFPAAFTTPDPGKPAIVPRGQKPAIYKPRWLPRFRVIRFGRLPVIPTTVSANLLPSTKRVAIYGFRPGFGRIRWEANPTSLSGILAQNLNTTASPFRRDQPGVNATAFLDSFTICDRNMAATGPFFHDRAADDPIRKLPDPAQPDLRDNAIAQGGGMCTIDSGRPD